MIGVGWMPHRHSWLSTLCLGVLLALSARAADAAPAKVALCFANGSRTKVECTASSREDRAVRYARSQCQYWKRQHCTRIFRCVRSGWAAVAYDRRGRFASACGMSSRRLARERVKRQCGRRCLAFTYKLGAVRSLSRSFGRVPKKYVGQRLTEARSQVGTWMVAIAEAKLPLPGAGPSVRSRFLM